MEGWTASEVGHQHYQHPKREAQHFDEKLDRFSSLVIYLSLLALAEQPGLWQEYHDENLLFRQHYTLSVSKGGGWTKLVEGQVAAQAPADESLQPSGLRRALRGGRGPRRCP